ncbi:hypothetical protein QBC46DRAFT_347429 [Diplogelasinospora grovesii]|uniref:Uncharacterized protein n=1 Tax=Diplogelasinospora grovesii TaxID=303347 RepID=A0AAN6MX20_9PEZI|nr:hypothetical protein QBC46DRAFT_347429 [Diplogelasinospora grovesii]
MPLVKLLAASAAIITPMAVVAQNYPTEYYFTTTITAPPDTNPSHCPTVTATTNQCRTCYYPMCLVLSTLTQHCGCSEPIATAYTSYPCESRCVGIGCSTAWTVVTADCTTSVTSTTQVTSTITTTSTASSSSTGKTTVYPCPPDTSSSTVSKSTTCSSATKGSSSSTSSGGDGRTTVYPCPPDTSSTGPSSVSTTISSSAGGSPPPASSSTSSQGGGGASSSGGGGGGGGGSGGGGSQSTESATATPPPPTTTTPPPTGVSTTARSTSSGPTCGYLSFLWESLVVELPKTSDEDFAKRLETLPEGIEKAPFCLYYHNGPLPNTPRRSSRAVKPEPAELDNLVADEADYVRTEGKFYPGAMISSLNKSGEVYSSTSAGVLVQKGQQQRLTCSWHNWEDHVKQHPGKFGQTDTEAQRIFRAAQGAVDGDAHKAGTAVGYVRERIGDTDIALAQLDNGIVFENTFMDIDASAKTLVSTNDQNPGDEYLIDSHVTGMQKLKGYGATANNQSASPKKHHHHHHLLPPDNAAYIAARQGAFATNSTTMTSEPRIRDSVCGSVLLRCRDVTKGEESRGEVLKRGEVCAMVHYADLQSKHSLLELKHFLIYADAFDPLIEDGWAVVQPADDDDDGGDKDAEKDTNIANRELGTEPEEESPAKKQKRV